VLLNSFHISHAVAGHDFVFGYNREGNVTMLGEYLQKHDIATDDVGPVMDANHTLWSSTRIRDDLAKGEPKKAAEALGRFWEIEGEVVQGAQRGRTIGFPTANLNLGEFLRPRFGVYVAAVTYGGKTYKGVANIGIRPSVDGQTENLEVHIMDFNSDLYGKNIRVGLVEFIRPEQRFDGLEALKVQITQDCLVARQMLS
jgi:riboflavin kinase / FMN adenylyltransferase